MWRSLRNSGKLLIKGNVPKSKGYKDFNKFLDKLAEKILKKSADFMSVDPEYPIYAYSEKSFHTILTPSIYELTKSFIVESPVKRYKKPKRNSVGIDSHGWVDYWIQYESIRIYLELKHGWLNTKSGNPQKHIQELWNNMKKQLENTENEANYDQRNWAGNKTVFRAGMLILPFYQKVTAKSKSDAKKKLKSNQGDFEEIFNNVFDKLDPKPKWGSLMLMHSNFHNDLIQDQDGGMFIFRPGYMVLMNIMEISKS